MPQNNLRIIYNNLVDLSSTSITVSPGTAGGYSTDNLKNDIKSSVWKSTGSTATLTVSFATAQSIGGVAIPYSSLSSSATISFTVYAGPSGTGGPVTNGTVSSISACPSYVMHTDTVPSASNFAYGTSRIARAWLPANVTGQSVIITITDTRTIEIGKLVVGSYWSAVCNTKFGLGMTYSDLTSVTRLESGDAIVNPGTRYKTLRFDLGWLLAQDRPEFRRILQNNGTRYPMFVSLFPQIQQVGATPTAEEYDLEFTYSLYGRQTQVSDLINSNYTVYSNSVEIQEI